MRVTDALENNPHVSLAALEALHTDVLGWALSRCDFNLHVAEDLVQQAYMEILSGRARFDAEASLKTFVFGVVRNLASSRLRRLTTRLRILRRYAAEAGADGAAPPEPDRHDGLWQAVMRLPARQRDIVELVFCRDLTIEEAARVMGVATGTGRVHYDRAKRALRRELGATLGATGDD